MNQDSYHQLVEELAGSERRGTLLETQARILGLVLSGAPMLAVLDEICLLMEQQLESGRCTVLLFDPERRRLMRGAAPSMPEFYTRAIDGLAIGRDVGACGAAAWRRERVLIEDVMTSANCEPYRDLFKQVDVRACWSEPVFASDGNVLGTFAIYYPRPRLPDPWELELIKSAAGLASIAIERQQKDDALTAGAEELRQIIDLVPHMVFAKNDRGEFLLANRAVADCYGESVDSIIGRGQRDLHPVESEVAQYLADDHVVISEGTPRFIAEEPFTDWTGQQRIFQTSKIPFWYSRRREPAVLGVAVDITERKRTEAERRELDERLKEAQKLESLALLAGGIAHDFNNLLMSILGNAGLALASDGLPGDARESLREIESSTERAADLANQMLAYSGKGKFVVKPFDLNLVVQEMAQLLHTSISRKAKLHIEPDSDLPSVHGDVTQIRQIVMNLITNASQAMDGIGGAITIRTGVKAVDEEYLAQTILGGEIAPGEYVVLEVTDTGCGMDEETQRRIFDPFYTTKFAGRGLGLAAVLGIARSHLGAVRVQSAPGVGTTFRVLLPTCDLPAEAITDIPAVSRWRGQGRVLVVDDEKPVQVTVRRMLERLGFEVLLADDGRDAIDVFRSERDSIDLVLLDMTMPRLGGLETFQELDRIRPGVRVLLSSGYSAREATGMPGADRLAGFIQKPYRSRELAAKLRGILEGA